jgi:hypothetical protein
MTQGGNVVGNFYTNITLAGVTQTAVATALAGRRSIVTPVNHDTVVVFDEACSGQDVKALSALTSALSKVLDCPALAFLNHDDDVLCFELYLGGKLVDEYNSSPGYFEAAEDPPRPTGGDATKLCEAFGASDPEKVERILRKSLLDADRYTFEFQRHLDLVQSLNISPFSVGVSYGDFDEDQLPDGLSVEDVIKTQ